MKMFAKLLLLISLMTTSLSICAQDTIFVKSGAEIRAVVLEIEPSVVKYKKYDNSTGPTYSLPKTDIIQIKYHNGDKDVFSVVTESRESEVPEYVKQKTEQDLFLRTKQHHVYNNNNTQLSADAVRQLLSSQPGALSLYNGGKDMKTISNIFIYPSGFCLGWGLGEIIFPSKENTSTSTNKNTAYTLIGVGIVGCVIGGILDYNANNKVKAAIELYNSSLSNNKDRYSIKFGLNNSGLGLALTF